MDRKIFAGHRIRQMRERRGLRQFALAELLGISPSYLNQLESDQRPLTGGLLARLAATLDVPKTYFADSEDVRRSANLAEALGDPIFSGSSIAPESLQAVVRAAPEFSDAFMALYTAHKLQQERAQEGANLPAAPRVPYDEVRDWVQSRQNHFDALDHAAEALFEGAGFSHVTLREDFTRYLRDRHAIRVAGSPDLLAQGTFWRLNRAGKTLVLAEDASFESKCFWMAHVIGQLEQQTLMERDVRTARLSTEEARHLGRITLANYFAGALMMPYDAFHAAARNVRHDIQRLQRQFGASFEQVCHRLSTMQRPNLPGIPFFFAKTDIAGNILKRSSATRFQFAQFGGPCPLWNVYRAFSHPGEVLVQLATAPDEITYLNIARTVGRGGSTYLSRPRAVAVVLGCEVRFASQTVYAAGLDLKNPSAADPIGPGCRACERTACRHRSVPPLGRPLDIGTAERGAVPYRVL